MGISVFGELGGQDGGGDFGSFFWGFGMNIVAWAFIIRGHSRVS